MEYRCSQEAVVPVRHDGDVFHLCRQCADWWEQGKKEPPNRITLE